MHAKIYKKLKIKCIQRDFRATGIIHEAMHVILQNDDRAYESLDESFHKLDTIGRLNNADTLSFYSGSIVGMPRTPIENRRYPVYPWPKDDS